MERGWDDPASPPGEVSHGRWHHGQRPPKPVASCTSLALVSCSVLPPLLLPRERPLAEPCLFGIPGRQLAAALITAPKWQLDLLFTRTAQAARFTVLCSLARRHCCSIQSSLPAPCATQSGEKSTITTKFKGVFPRKGKTPWDFLQRDVLGSHCLLHPLAWEEAESSGRNLRSAIPKPKCWFTIYWVTQ